MAPSSISFVFLVLNERKFLFSSANATFNEALIETHNAYLNACLNERQHEEDYCVYKKSGLIPHSKMKIFEGIFLTWQGLFSSVPNKYSPATPAVKYLHGIHCTEVENDRFFSGQSRQLGFNAS